MSAMNDEAKKESLKREILQTLSDINAVLTGVDRLMDGLQVLTDGNSRLAVAEKTATQSFDEIHLVLKRGGDVMQQE